MSEKARLLKNTGLIAIGNFGAKMISFLLLPLYTSILDTAEYGEYDFIIAVSLFILPIVTMSLYEAMFRFIIEAGEKGKRFDEIITNVVIAETIGIILMGMICIPISMVYNAKIVWFVFAYVAASAYYLIINNILRGLGKIKEYAIVSSGKNILQLILNVIAVAVFRWGMEGLVFSLCLSEMIAFIVVAIYSKIWKYINVQLFSIKEIKPMILYALPLIPNTLSSQIINISDRIIITGFINNSANGIYSIAYKFPNVIDTVYHFFYTAWSESAARVYEKNEEEAHIYYKSLHKMMDNFMFAVIVLMISGMPILFRIFIRGEYIDGFKYVPILMLAMYFASMAKIYSGIFTAYKKTAVMATSTIIAAIVNIIINIAFIKMYGLYAAAYSTLISNILLMIIRKKMLESVIKFTIPISLVISRVLIVVLVFMLYDYNNLYKTAISIVVCVVYTMLTNQKEIKSILNKICRR